MATTDTRYILCPGCEAAVRELGDTPCPECQRCALCGRKLKDDETHCHCGLIDDSGHVENLLRHNEIRADELGRERRRLEIRKQLTNRKVITGSLATGVVMLVYPAVRDRVAPCTTLSWILLILSFSELVMLGIMFNDWLFRRFESYRLETEFPDGDNSYQRPWR
jgi:hypothetical protein